MNPAYRRSLIGRALLAILLTIGFYTLALGIAFGLLWLIYLEIFVVGRVNIRLTLFAFIGAIVILWAIFPRIDRFEPPGPRLTRKKFPALFQEIEKIAQATGQVMPRDVYLIPAVNAFVAQRGGFMGAGSRRVMGIGLPLFYLLTVDELRAIITHEFGHFYGGDTSLGPWIYKTRSAIIRTVVGVGQTSGLLQIPFEAYAKLFLRVTNAISRQQEFTADQLSARVVGAQIAIAGLQKIHRYGMAFQTFFQQEYLPVINSGFQVPMIQGFEQFIQSPKMSDAISKFYEDQVNKKQADPYDTHPTLKERIDALENHPAGGLSNDQSASILVSDISGLEDQLLDAIAVDKEKIKALKEIDWNDTVNMIYIPQWEKSSKTYQSVLKDLTPLKLWDAAQNYSGLFDKIAVIGKILPPKVSSSQVPADQKLQVVANIIGFAFVIALYRNGWKINTSPGDDIHLTKAKKSIEPFEIFPKLAKRELLRDDWQKLCEKNGVSDISFESAS